MAEKNNDHELLSVYTDIGVKPRKELEDRGNKATTTDNYWIVKKGDIVVNKLLAWMGAVGLSNYDGVTSPAYDVLRAIKDIDTRYYNYIFRSSQTLSEFKKRSKGIMEMRLRLYFDELGQILFPIPPKDEQEAIANFLDKKCESVDNYILKQKELIELLKEKKSSLINKAVTKGLDSKVEYKDSGIEWLGEIPKHWEVKKLKYICQINKNTLGDKTSPNLEIEYVDIGNVSFENGIDAIEKYHFKNSPSRARRIAKYGDTIVSTVRTYLKAIAYVDANVSSYVYSTGFAILEPKRYFNNRYFTFMIKSDFFTEQVNINSKGMSYPAINSTDLGNLFLCFPPKQEQKQIVEYIEKESSKIDKAISHIEDEIKLLQEYKQSLISSAVTGKIKVV
mgnify:FL=1